MYLKNKQELEQLYAGAYASAVVLNESSNGEGAMPMHAVLGALLEARTHSFNALVGFFGHRGNSGEADQTLADLILNEAQRGVAEEEAFDDTAFRLAVGVNSSKAAQLTSHLWYWLCRYRHQADDGRQKTDDVRNTFLERARQSSFAEAATELLKDIIEPDTTDYPENPFRLSPEAFAQRLKPVRDEVPHKLRDTCEHSLKTIRHELKNPDLLDTIAKLFGFFLQRRADFRFNPKEQTNGTVTVFHPKIYVIERFNTEERENGDGFLTASVVGSHNWTRSALGITQGDQVISNVEVATLHVNAGHLWSGNGAPASLGRDVCGTASYLFDNSRYVLGAWQEAHTDRLLPSYMLEEVTKVPSQFFDPDTGDGVQVAIPEELHPLLPHLQQLAERLIGIEDLGSKEWRRYSEFFADDDKTTFAYTPAPYQLDAALRLISMVGSKPHEKHADAHRGAFLTDETGLGKTISGQMVATILLTERLKQRAQFKYQQKPMPLRVSFIVPARLSGDEERASGWRGHRADVEQAVRKLLQASEVVPESEVEDVMGLLDIRVFSIASFSRPLFDGEPKHYGPEEGKKPFDAIGLKEKVADDFLHVALSEVILVDESHNFRNEGSRRTRTFRFLSSLPLPGEKWKIVHPAADMRKDTDAEEAPDSLRLCVQRRMVCLSATPFNNDISDLTTQMGHFDQYQNWSEAYVTAQHMPEALEKALQTWSVDTSAAYTEDELADELRPSFFTLLKHVARHLHSGRQLSIPEDKIDKESRKETSDYGPRYEWLDGHNYVSVLKEVQRWARERERDVKGDSPEKEGQEVNQREVQERMDALLVELFVQRSRARVLRMAEASQGADIRKMFRKPRVPRYPVALNEGPETDAGGEEASTFEKEVLGALYRLLGKASDEETDATDVLSFQSYKIAIQRSREGLGGAAEVNFLGFQLTGLVKRLQSSPYAFYRTIVRGVLRHALTELALVEYMLEQLSNDAYTLNEQHILRRNRPALQNGLKDAQKFLRETKDKMKAIAELMGGSYVSEKDGRPFFQNAYRVQQGHCSSRAREG